MNALTELRAHLSFFSERCLTARWFGARLHVGVAQDILEDDAKIHARISQDAYSAEQADLEASKLIASTIADGVVTVAEIQELKKALRMIHRSAEEDRKISELARV